MKRRTLLAGVLITLAGALSLVALAAAIGLFLPRDHTASRSLRTRQTPEAVWRAVTDFANEPTWFRAVVSVERLPAGEGRERWRETYRDGESLTLETAEAIPPRRLVRRITDEGGPFSGRWEFEITPLPDGSRLTITEHGSIPNPLFRFVARFISGHTAAMESYLTDLAAKFGEAPALE